MQQNTNISLGTRNDFMKVSKCKSRCFLCQDYFIPRTSVKSRLYNKNVAAKLRGNVNFKTTDVIYLLECNKCCLEYVGETTNNIYKRFSGHKTTVNKEKTNNYLVQHCNNVMCSDITVTILENLELENLNKEEKNNRLRKTGGFQDPYSSYSLSFWAK